MTDNVREVLGRVQELRTRSLSYDVETSVGYAAVSDLRFAASIAEDLAEVALALLDDNVTRPLKIVEVTDAGDDWALECEGGGVFVSKKRCDTPIAGDFVQLWRNRAGRVYGVKVNNRLVSYREDLR